MRILGYSALAFWVACGWVTWAQRPVVRPTDPDSVALDPPPGRAPPPTARGASMTSIRFLHTSDWQLGMTRHYLEGEAQSRYTGDRVETAIRSGRPGS